MQNPRFTVVPSTNYLPHAIVDTSGKTRANFADQLTAELTCALLNSLWNAPPKPARRASDTTVDNSWDLAGNIARSRAMHD